MHQTKCKHTAIANSLTKINMTKEQLYAEALRYHTEGHPGKIEIRPTKPHATQYDLSLAYSPGVAAPSLAIASDPALSYEYTVAEI